MPHYAFQMLKIRNKILQLPAIAWFMGKVILAPFLQRMFSSQRREEAVLDQVRASVPRGDPAATLACMDDFARDRGWLMNVGPRKGEILAGALRPQAIARMLEIGAYCGYSAVLIGSILRSKGGHLISVEKSRHCAGIARQIVEHSGLADVVSMRRGVLTDFIDEFERPFDAVFLDHWKDEYLPDLQRLEQAGLLHQGTVIVADNIEFFDVPDYLQYVRSGGNYRSTFHKSSVEYNDYIDDGVEVSVYLGPEVVL